MGNDSIDFEEFFSAMGDTEPDDGNQTETEGDTTGAERETEEAQQPQEGAKNGEEDAEESTPDAEENAAADAQKSEEQQNEHQKFTIKYNHETREVGLPEMTALAQKGADYDRIRGKLEEAQQGQAALQKAVDEQAPILEVLQLAAKDAGVEVSELIETIHVGLLKGKGMTEAEAKAEIRAAKAEKAMNDLKNKPAAGEPQEDPNQERAKREIAEFQAAFPDVSLNPETLDKLAPDVRNGMTLTGAYLKLENARLKNELAESQRRLEAEKQNQNNRQKAAPGQTDSGGGRSRDSFDDFFDAFER